MMTESEMLGHVWDSVAVRRCRRDVAQVGGCGSRDLDDRSDSGVDGEGLTNVGNWFRSNRGEAGMGREASDASTDRFRRGGVGGAQHGLRCARGVPSRLPPRRNRVRPTPAATRLTETAGCAIRGEG